MEKSTEQHADLKRWNVEKEDPPRKLTPPFPFGTFESMIFKFPTSRWDMSEKLPPSG